MKIKGQNGVILDIPETVATGMVSAGIVEAVPDENPSAEGTLIAALTAPAPSAPVDTGADPEAVADTAAPASEPEAAAATSADTNAEAKADTPAEAEKPKRGRKSDK